MTHDKTEQQRVQAEEGRVQAEEDRVDAEVGDGGHLLEQSRVRAEEERVEAEDERQAYELRRRIAEGGPDQHVPGNEEPGRFEAEQARDLKVRRMYPRILWLVSIPFALIAVGPALIGIVRLNQQNERLEREIQARCVDSKVNRDAIRSSFLDGFAVLGYRYDTELGRPVQTDAAIDYYALHPDERAAALERLVAGLARFPAIEC